MAFVPSAFELKHCTIFLLSSSLFSSFLTPSPLHTCTHRLPHRNCKLTGSSDSHASEIKPRPAHGMGPIPKPMLAAGWLRCKVINTSHCKTWFLLHHSASCVATLSWIMRKERKRSPQNPSWVFFCGYFWGGIVFSSTCFSQPFKPSPGKNAVV